MQAIENKQGSYSGSRDRIMFLDNVRAIAVIMVIGVHTLDYCVMLPHNLSTTVSFIVTVVAVPIFFLVDGYLFARSVMDLKSYGYLKHVRYSLFRLLVPWVFFTLAYAVARYGFEATGFLHEKLIVGHAWEEVVLAAYGSVYAPQMYFLLSLFLVRLCSPLLEVFIKRKRYFVLLIFFFCYKAAYETFIPIISHFVTIVGGQEPILHAFWGVQFYLVGILLHRVSTVIELKSIFIPVLLLFIFSVLIQATLTVNMFALIQYLYLLTCFLFFVYCRVELSILNLIGRNTMGIYLVHAPIVLKGVSLIFQKLIVDPILSFVSILCGTLITSLLIVIGIEFIRRYCLDPGPTQGLSKDSTRRFSALSPMS